MPERYRSEKPAADGKTAADSICMYLFIFGSNIGHPHAVAGTDFVGVESGLIPHVPVCFDIIAEIEIVLSPVQSIPDQTVDGESPQASVPEGIVVIGINGGHGIISFIKMTDTDKSLLQIQGALPRRSEGMKKGLHELIVRIGASFRKTPLMLPVQPEGSFRRLRRADDDFQIGIFLIKPFCRSGGPVRTEVHPDWNTSAAFPADGPEKIAPEMTETAVQQRLQLAGADVGD